MFFLSLPYTYHKCIFLSGKNNAFWGTAFFMQIIIMQVRNK